MAAKKRAFPPLVVPIITPLLLTSMPGSGVLPGTALKKRRSKK